MLTFHFSHPTPIDDFATKHSTTPRPIPKTGLIWCAVFHVSKAKPFDADQAWQDHLDRVSRREPYSPSSIFHTTYPFSRYPLYLVYSKRPPPPSDIKFDPHRAWLDHLDRLAELDKIYPSLFPLSSYRGLSPTPTKVGADKTTTTGIVSSNRPPGG